MPYAKLAERALTESMTSTAAATLKSTDSFLVSEKTGSPATPSSELSECPGLIRKTRLELEAVALSEALCVLLLRAYLVFLCMPTPLDQEAPDAVLLEVRKHDHGFNSL